VAAEQFLHPTFPNANREPLIDHGILTGRPFIAIEAEGQRFRVVGNRVYTRPLNETFHEFIINHLRDTLRMKFAADWGSKQETLPTEKQHPIYRWHTETIDAVKTRGDRSGISSVVMTGNIKALRALAFDIYTLEHHSIPFRTEHWLRLQHVDQFQGVRYEIAVAAMACRVGFKIEWCSGKGKKGEFLGTHLASGQKIVFEAKSHHRAGILGRDGSFDPVNAKIKIEGHLKEALEQTQDAKLPLILFDDLNLPIDAKPMDEEKWFKDIEKVFSGNEFLAGLHATHYGALMITNFGWHFHEKLPSKKEVDVLSYWHTGGQYSLDPGIIRLLSEAGKQYGTVPAMLGEMGDFATTPPPQQLAEA
jgi:hypothetical protein